MRLIANTLLPVRTQDAESTMAITSARDCELPASVTGAIPESALFSNTLAIPNYKVRRRKETHTHKKKKGQGNVSLLRVCVGERERERERERGNFSNLVHLQIRTRAVSSSETPKRSTLEAKLMRRLGLCLSKQLAFSLYSACRRRRHPFSLPRPRASVP